MWLLSTGQAFGEVFDNMMNKCPDFYEFGLMDEVTCPERYELAHFLVGINDQLKELFYLTDKAFLIITKL